MVAVQGAVASGLAGADERYQSNHHDGIAGGDPHVDGRRGRIGRRGVEQHPATGRKVGFRERLCVVLLAIILERITQNSANGKDYDSFRRKKAPTRSLEGAF